MKSLSFVVTASALLTSVAGAQSAPAHASGNALPAYRLRAVSQPQPAASTFAPAPLVGGADSCASPDVVVGVGMFAFDDTLATTGAEGQGESACNVSFGSGTAVLNDVWFTWVAPNSGVATFETCGLTTVDTKIAVYAGNTCPAASALACNDDACGGFTFQSGLTFPCVVGNSYVLQLGLYPGTFPAATPGTGSFRIAVAALALNDDCTAATSISGSGPFAFDNSAATTGTQGQSEASCLSFGSTAIVQDTWYTWTAPSTATFAVVTHGLTRVDTKVAVYDGAGCPVAAALGCNDDARSDSQSVTTFAATSGNTYTIQLGSSFGSAGGSGEFGIVPTTPPVNDACATPTTWTGTGTFLFDNTFATTGVEGQGQAACSFFTSASVANDVWYAWTPGTSGTAVVSSCLGTSVDTKIAVHAGSTCPVSAPIVCQDDTPAGCGPTTFQTEVTFPVACGQTYLIQVGTYPLYSPPAVGGLGRIDVSISGAVACPVPAVAYCFGDGTGAACPCSNTGATGNGCASSINASGGNLTATGTASIANDTLILQGSGVPDGPGLYFQGTTQLAGGSGVSFGDGLRCVGGTVIRLGIIGGVGNASTYPTGVTPPFNTPISVRGFVSAGQSLNYQLWYRDSGAFCTVSVFNLTNALNQVWVP